MEQSYNSRCPAVKRLLREAQELHEATEEYYAVPLEDNLFEWHFTVRGPPQTEFDGGIYHGRIIMPAEYPMKPPNIIFLTPNGRFETNKKICLSISGYHPETWQPSWSIRTALLAIVGFMPTPANGTIGSLEYPAAERERLAKKSLEYQCTECGNVGTVLRDRTSNNEEFQKEARQVLSQVAVATKNETKSESEGGDNTGTTNTVSTTSKSPPANETGQTTNNSSTPSTATTSPTSSTSERLTEQRSQGTTGSTTSRNNTNNTQQLLPAESSGFLNNFVLSAAVFLFVALLLRRLFLMESDTNEEFEDILG